MDRYVLLIGRRDGHRPIWVGVSCREENPLAGPPSTEDPMAARIYSTHAEAMRHGVGVPVLLEEHMLQHGITRDRCRSIVAGYVSARRSR